MGLVSCDLKCVRLIDYKLSIELSVRCRITVSWQHNLTNPQELSLLEQFFNVVNK